MFQRANVPFDATKPDAPPTEGIANILYTDPADGQVWTVPEGHRIWTEIYEPWLAAGNTPLPPA